MSMSTWWAYMLEGLDWFFTGKAGLQLPVPKQIEGSPAFILLCIILLFWSIRWTARDAKARGKAGFTAALFVLIAAWPISWLFWLWVRPPLLEARPATPSSTEPTMIRPLRA